MKKTAVALVLAFLTFSASASYDKNKTGKIKNIYTYPSGLVLFRFESGMPTHPVCNNKFFSIGTDVPEAAANRMFSRLMTLDVAGKEAYIGYDSLGDCANGYIRVHNVGNAN